MLLGKSGYLYLWEGRQEQFSHLTGDKSVPALSRNNFVKNVVDRHQYLTSRDIPYTHVVFPSKPLVKKNFLPQGLCVDSLYSKFPQTGAVLYPLVKLQDVESEISTFRRLDTHMTDAGSLVVVELLINKLDPALFSQVRFESRDKTMSGDLAKMMQSDEKSLETLYEPVHFNGTPFYSRSFNNNTTLAGNSGRISVVHCSNSVTAKRLLVFGDSFFQATLKFLNAFFRDILFIRTPFVFNELIELFKPDVVFTGNAERYLQSVPNDNDRDFFFFQSFYRSNYDPELEFTQALQAQLSFSSDISNYKRWSKNLEASLLNEQANLLMATGKFYAASELLREAVSIKPNNIKLQQKLVSCLEKLN